jgi:hypothetical protein
MHACGWQEKDASRILVGKLEGERPLERSRHRWESNIKMYCDGLTLPTQRFS